MLALSVVLAVEVISISKKIVRKMKLTEQVSVSVVVHVEEGNQDGVVKNGDDFKVNLDLLARNVVNQKVVGGLVYAKIKNDLDIASVKEDISLIF